MAAKKAAETTEKATKKTTKKVVVVATPEAAAEHKAKRTKAAEEETAEAPKKKTTRKKVVVVTAEEAPAEAEGESAAVETAEEKPKAKRGRKAKTVEAAEVVAAPEEAEEAPKAKRGRAKKAKDDADENADATLMFQERLEKLLSDAKSNSNMIDPTEITKAFADMNLEDEQYESVNQYLESQGIDIVSVDDNEDETLLSVDDDEDKIDDDEVPNDELMLIEKEEAEEADKAGRTGVDAINIEDPVRMYLKEIGKVPLLTADEEVAIAKRMENGIIAHKILKNEFKDVAADDKKTKVTNDMVDAHFKLPAKTEEEKAAYEEAINEKYEAFQDADRDKLEWIEFDGEQAKNKLAEANLRLVVSIAKRYVGRGMLFLDLIQEGNLGLIKAVEKFDFRKGFKFSTYATWWIRQAITRAIADQARTIRIPVHMVETINKLVRVSRQLLQELGREPSPEEIAAKMGIPVERVREIIKISQEPVSLETPIGEEEDSHLGDFIQDENVPVPADAAAYTMLREQLQEVLGTLTEREQKVLRLRFGLDDGRARTLEEVGKKFNVTRERIRQIEAKALRKLRHPSRSRKLKDYLD